MSLLVQFGAASVPSKAQTVDRRIAANKKKLKGWCRLHRFLRPVLLKGVAALKDLAARLDPPHVIGNNNVTAAVLKSALEQHLVSHPDASLRQAPSTEEEASQLGVSSTDSLTRDQKLLHACLSSSFMAALKGEARESTRRGLELERPLVQQFLKDSRNGLTLIKAHEVGRAPLVTRTGIPIESVGGSTDFVCVAGPAPGQPEDTTQLIVVEGKGRVSHTTEGSERVTQGLARLRAARAGARHQSAKKYWIIDAMSELFPYFVKDRKEAVQCLHHAYVYDVEYVLLLIGNNNGTILAGIWIRYDDSLKSAWGNVLQFIHSRCLTFIYRDPGNPIECNRGFLDPVLRAVNANKAPLDYDSFVQWTELWRIVRLTWPSPLPPVKHIIPFLLALWNAAKGGSDTISKLIWLCDYDPPNRLIQAHAVARLMLLVFSQIHRMNHLATAKENLGFYSTLLSYRGAANKRYSFHQTLVIASRSYALSLATVAVSVDEEDHEQDSSVQRTTRSQSNVVKMVAHATGMTPKRNVRSKMEKLADKDQEQLTASQQMQLYQYENCIGPTIWGKRGTCVVCGRDTKWYCLGCHLNFCALDVPDDGSHPMELQVSMVAPDGKTTVMTMRNNCFCVKHDKAIRCRVCSGNSLDETRRVSLDSHD